MKKISIAMLLGLLSIAAFTQNNKAKVVLPPNFQIDTRIDNMGYWQRLAELGLVPVQAMYKPVPAVFTGSQVFTNKGVLVTDSPDVPVTTNVNTESENSIAVEFGDNDRVFNSNNATPQPSNGTTSGADWYNSSDGAATFNGNSGGAGGNNSGDPAACINLDGRFFVGYITSSGHQGVSYSDDHGTNWTPVIACPAGTAYNILDKNHLWVDISPTSPNKGYIYDAWMHLDNQIHVCRSITNGTSYETDISISSGTQAGSHNQGVNIKTGPDGEVYCAWAVYDSWPSDEKAIGFSKSLDGGVTWSTAFRAINNIKGIRNNGSLTQNQRSNSFPSMTCDISNGPHRGTIYVVWTNIGVPGVNTGPGCDVYMMKSTDKGDTWSTPTRINTVGSDGKDHYFPWITCDPANGYLGVVFYDGRNVSSSQVETYMAYSSDGGNSWTDMKVSDVSFTPAPIPNMATGYMGDYLAISAYDGRFYPAWTDNRIGYCMTYVSPIVLVVPMAFVGVTASILNDTTYGNGNGKMDFGETELLGLSMKNTGTAPADSVTVTVTPNSPYITMIDSTEFFGDFSIGGSKTIMDAFKFTVSDSIPHGMNVQFLVKARDKNDSVWTTSFTIMSHAPAVTIMSTTINDPAPGGNGNGRLDPGETVTLNIVTKNTGDYDAVNAISDLFRNNPYVSIVNPSQGLGTLIPGQQVTVPFTVSVNPTAAIGSAVVFRNYAHAVTQHDQKIWTERIGLIVEDWETGNFTKFPWQFTDTPWVICDTVVWEKLHSAQTVHMTGAGNSGLTLHYNVLLDDSISFHRKLHSQPLADMMKFYIDGSMVGQWSGNSTTWKYSAFPVLAGPHDFKWEFLKTSTANPNDFSAYLDFIVFPPEYKTTANAGGSATVCSGLSYQLNGMASSFDSVLWTTSGTGIFSDPKIVDPLYTPSAGDITAGSVNLTLTAFSSLTHDTASVMTLTIVPAPVANAGGDQEICAGSTYTAALSSATNYSALSWSTSGDGSFDNAATLHPVYTPGANDLVNGHPYLKLSLTPAASGCPVTSDSLLLTINALPVIKLGNDTTICADKHIILDPKVTDATAFLWHPSNATTPTLNVDSTGTGLGIKTISVDVTNSKACKGSGTIKVTFKNCTGIGELSGVTFRMYPNPNNGIFTMEFNAFQNETLTIEVMNTSGVTVYSLNNIEVSGFVSKKMDLGLLPDGTYLFRISNGKESTLRKLVVKK
ncbi:MAG: T9SS type A sorting domain-containing protein [Bacteroidetes bacterium]|nr:T9SS type A sorting domain-containing protein [Bacteroidota bacterium]